MVASGMLFTPDYVRVVRDALDQAGVPYDILAFADEGHGIGRPKNQKILYLHLAEFFRASPDAGFETEELFVADDRCTARWTYRYSGAEGAPHHTRGVDVFRVRDGKVAERLSYVKD